MSDEERLEQIETRIAYQELAIEDLGESLGALRERLRQLEQLVRRVAERLDQGTAQPSDPGDERPPHY